MIAASVFVTMAVAIAAWAAVECRLAGRPASTAGWPRVLWAVGAAAALAHAAAAFEAFYGWSHATAVAATARQTAELVGFDWGGGLYLNYVFLSVWTGDAAWWCLRPRSYTSRRVAVSAVIRGFLFFMFLNGAVVFADGWMRALGAAATAAVTVTWSRTVLRSWTAMRPRT
jgi:hypothetical protein